MPSAAKSFAAGIAIIIGPFPREFRASRTVARPVAHVEIGFHSHEGEFATILADKGDVRRFEKIEVFPLDLDMSGNGFLDSLR